MKIHIYSPDSIIIKIIGEELESKGHLCTLFSDLITFFDTFHTQVYRPDLLLIDYTSWIHEQFSLSEKLRERKYFVPFIYYNEPFPSSNSRVFFWQVCLEDFLCYFPKITIEELQDMVTKYTEVFKQIASIVESEALSPYIPLLQQPLPLPENIPLKNAFKYLSSVKTRENLSYSKIPPRFSFMLDYLLKNQDKVITIQDMQKYYSDNNKIITEESLRVKISNLKKFLNEQTDLKYTLISKDYTYTLRRLK